MKALIVSLLFPVLLKSCEAGMPDQIGRRPDPVRTPPAGGSGDDTNGLGSDGTNGPGTTNAPFDGGLTFLLLAGVGYGAKKYRDRQQKDNSF